ncbi:MAG TPA: hypothetical protein PLN52_16275 [Opitutaceae bacterium]|nr:hypothetical protein [Opitutaceae bacterium]
MKTSSLIALLASAALVGFGLTAIGLAADAFVLAAFSGTMIALLLLAAVRDYAPRARRFELKRVPTATSRSAATRRSARFPLAA